MCKKNTGWFFLTGSALKVLRVGDGKIATKKVKIRVKTSHISVTYPYFHFFARDFAISNGWNQSKKPTCNCAFCGLPLQHEYFKKEIYSSLPQNATNWRSRWIKACNIGKKGCWFLLILSLVRTKTRVCPIGLLVKTPLPSL